MSPEEEYESELKWVLLKIKKALLTAGPDSRVDFNASRLTNRDPDSPSLDAIYNHIKALERDASLRITERYDGDGYDVYGYSRDAGAGVTGYGFIVDRQKFTKLYEKHFKPRATESDKSFDFEKEKRNIAAVDSADDHKIIADKWVSIKCILDALNKLLSPIAMTEVQTVTLYSQFLPREQSYHFASLMIDMFKADVVGDVSRTMQPVVAISHLAKRTLSGEEIPIRTAAFRAYRKKVSELVVWIETDALRFKAPTEPTAIHENDSSGALVQEQPFPRLKAGTQWKDFTFRFIDDENAIVKVANGNNVEHKISYADLGCDDKRKARYPLYDIQWKFLLALAASYGEIAPGSSYFKDGNEKAKEILTKRFQEYFHVPDDPFYAVDTYNSVKKRGSYKLRSDIFPPPMGATTDSSPEDELSRDIHESYEMEARIIDEPD